MFEKDTDKLFEELKIEPDVENFLAQNENEFKMPLHEYLNKLLQKKNLKKSDIVQKINANDKHIYHIFSGAKKPSREKLLTIARAMGLNLDETQYLLRYGGFAILYPRDTWDAVIISAIENNLSIIDTDIILEQLKLPLLNNKI
ncbi:MAG: DNA-binding protein [Selenomonadaceae bacterium]|nr:DNA-binding protein [Selenomonadaceae bacterium]